MNKVERKNKILELLQFNYGWLGISAIVNSLGDGFKNRTVRRLLAELRDEGFIIRRGRGPNTQYKSETKYDRQIESINNKIEDPQAFGYSLSTIFCEKSLTIIKSVRQPIFQRKPVSYNKQWVDLYQPNKTFYFTDKQREKMQKQGKRANLNINEPAGTYSRKILTRLLIDLSYNSSRLEGNTYSKLDTEKLLLQGMRQTDKMDKEMVMILNHKDAIEFLVRQALSLVVSYEAICTLHYLLSDSLLPNEYMGKVRNEGVRIGQSTYLPLEDRLRLESNLIYIVDKASHIIDPFEQSLFLLIHIAYLQPFMDVNKRTSRLAANIPFIKTNRVPLSFSELDKDDYISAMLAVYELNQVTPMAELFYFSYIRTCQAYDATIESVGFDPIRVKYRQQRRALITQVIRGNLVGTEKDQHILKNCTSHNANIEENEIHQFIESIEVELKHLTANTIAGLGVSQTEFKQWKKN